MLDSKDAILFKITTEDVIMMPVGFSSSRETHAHGNGELHDPTLCTVAKLAAIFKMV